MRRSLTFVFALAAMTSTLYAKPPLFIVLGPPGGGKTSLSRKFSDDAHLPRVSLNQLLLKRSKDSDERALEIRKMMKAGQPLPDDTILSIISNRSKKQDCKDGFILVGCPKTKTQAEHFVAKFSPEYELIIININIDDDVIVERLANRRICSNCSKPYHTKSNPPIVMGHCNQCNGLLVSREKDNLEVVKKRLDIYRNQYEPMHAYLQQSLTWIDVNNNEFEKCYESLISQLNNHQPKIEFKELCP